MKTPGIEIRPLVEMTGDHLFNEVFFTDVHIPADALIGEEGNGWAMARDTLDNERVTLARAGLQWGWGPTAEDLVAGRARRRRRRRTPSSRCGSSTRTSSTRSSASTACAWSRPRCRDVRARKRRCARRCRDPHGQKTFILSKDLAGANGHAARLRPARRPIRCGGRDGFLFAPALTIGGGTSEVIRNVIAERMLGLPREKRRGRRQAVGRSAPKARTRVPEPAVLYDVDGHVATVTFNRPEARNAVNPEVIVRLADAWDAIDGDDDVRVAILTGTGGHFCAGADLDKLVGQAHGRRRPRGRVRSAHPGGLLDHLQGLPAVVTASRSR